MGVNDGNTTAAPTLGRKLVYSLLILVAFGVLLELLLRAWFFAAGQLTPRARHLDGHYGWVTLPNLSDQRHFEGYGTVRYSTTRDGFRVFGDPDSADPKVFVIGDSQTQARTVSDGETYYDYIGAHSNAQVFAYGGSGYGSLQEYMILDAYFDRIGPDLVLWQYCNNDLQNNLFELEANSRDNNRMVRPYLEDGVVVRRYPHASWFYRNILRHSYLVRFTGLRLDLFLATHLEDPIRPRTADNPVIARALDVTREIMTMVKRRVGDTPVWTFSACGREAKPINSALASVSDNSGLVYLKGVPDAVRRARKEGVVVDGSPRDGHWNGTGHAIAGRFILDAMTDRGLVHAIEQPLAENQTDD